MNATTARALEAWKNAAPHARGGRREVVLSELRYADDATKARVLDLLLANTKGRARASAAFDFEAMRDLVADIFDDISTTNIDEEEG